MRRARHLPQTVGQQMSEFSRAALDRARDPDATAHESRAWEALSDALDRLPLDALAGRTRLDPIP